EGLCPFARFRKFTGRTGHREDWSACPLSELCSTRGGRGWGGFLAASSPQGDVGLQVFHQFGKLREVEGLCAVADGFLGRGMRFDEEAVGADGYACSRDGRH